MKVAAYQSVEQQPVMMPGSKNCHVRWLIGPKDGAPNFAMRQFEVAVDGFTPKHSHPYEHEVFVLEGEGTVSEGERVFSIKSGDVVFVAPNEIHQFKNVGNSPLKFLCFVPNDSMNMPITQVPECGVEIAD